VISGFRREVVENYALLGYYAASSGNFVPMFRNNHWVPSSGLKNPIFWIQNPIFLIQNPIFWILEPWLSAQEVFTNCNSSLLKQHTVNKYFFVFCLVHKSYALVILPYF